MKGQVGLRPAMRKALAASGPGQGLLAVGAMHAQLGQQRVVERRNRVARPGRRRPPGRPGRRAPAFGDLPGPGQEPDGSSAYTRSSMACPAGLTALPSKDGGWPEAMRNCCSTRSMPVTSSVMGCSTCSRVFISRKTNESASASTRHSTVPAPRYPTASQAPDGGGQHPLAQPGRDTRRRGFLSHLLMPPLHRAVALAQREHPAVGQAEDLYLNVPGSLDVTLDEDIWRAEEPLRARAGRLERRTQARLIPGHAHADPAAPGRRLDHDRVPDLVRLGHGRGHVACGAPGCPGRLAPRPAPSGSGPRSCRPSARWHPGRGLPTSARLREPG